MKIQKLEIKNFKSIRHLQIAHAENALILVGKNGAGKTMVIDALLAVAGVHPIDRRCYYDKKQAIEIAVTVADTGEDAAVPEGEAFTVRFVVRPDGKRLYLDETGKERPELRFRLPRIHYIDNDRNVTGIQEEIFALQGGDVFEKVKNGRCMLEEGKKCTHCFSCIEQIRDKKPLELSVIESARLMEYQIHNMNIRTFSEKVNEYFERNDGMQHNIRYSLQLNQKEMFTLDTIVSNKNRRDMGSVEQMSEGTKSIYLLSLLEAYIDAEGASPCIIMIEDPENYLHPQMQKVASEILYRLSKKNQVIFSTHSPNMIFNFTQKQIKQVVFDQETYTTRMRENVDLDEILDDLGFAANDLMNVSFVFIVEGKQDRQRLPLLLNKYYAEMYDEDGRLKRISIIPTNSCTNIKTYANLKYINQLYLKDQFLMIRDSDGKSRKMLANQLCSYYDERARAEGAGNLPRILPRNVLVLKYYSFENYFLDPKVMTEIGVLKQEEEFYTILEEKCRAYLYKLSSWKHLERVLGKKIRTKQELKKQIEFIKIYVRGHNLFDIFYGRYKGARETEILTRYIDAAPRACFADILEAIDGFVYFDSRKKNKGE